MSCNLCPRMCNADRHLGQKGYCGHDSNVRISKVMLHMWEEPCVSGTRGSGAVFFSGCSLRCVYCQNSEIALKNSGKIVSKEELGKIYVSLQEKGAHNINLVTPTHFMDSIARSVLLAKNNGLKVPVVYNTGGYELSERIDDLKGIADVYLTDFKYIRSSTAHKYSNAPNYPAYAKASLEKMVSQMPEVIFDDNGIIKKGVIVRHLLLPGSLDNSKAVIEYLFKTYGDNIYISIMNQYTPLREFEDFPELSYTPSRREYEKLMDYAISLGVKNAYIQSQDSSDKKYIPNFNEFTF